MLYFLPLVLMVQVKLCLGCEVAGECVYGSFCLALSLRCTLSICKLTTTLNADSY